MLTSEIKTIVIFLGGVVLGGVIGVTATKNYFQDKYKKISDERVEELEHYYRNTSDYGCHRDEEEEEQEPDPEEFGSLLTLEERKKAKERIRENVKRRRTNYSGMYQGSEEINDLYDKIEKAAEEEHPVDSDEDEGLLTEETLEEEAFERHQAVLNSQTEVLPKIISSSALGDLPPETDMRTLLYYTEDGSLIEEDGGLTDIIVDPSILIGDALTKYDFIDNDDEESIIVYNKMLDTCYEIVKVFGSVMDFIR